MSTDNKLFKICDHLIFEEEVQIDANLKTISLPRTLSSQNVTLYINGFEIERDNVINAWNIEDNEQALFTKKSKIVFKRKRRSSTDFYQVSYSVLPNLCPKCIGLRTHNDESYSNLGLLNKVRNEEKLLQEVRKMITTELGSNPFHEWLGTNIHLLIGSKVFNIDNIRANMVQEITTMLDKYLDIQTSQSQYQEVTDREAYLQTILVDAFPEEDDPSIWSIAVIFQNRTGADMVFEKKVKIPALGQAVNNPASEFLQRVAASHL